MVFYFKDLEDIIGKKATDFLILVLIACVVALPFLIYYSSGKNSNSYKLALGIAAVLSALQVLAVCKNMQNYKL